MNELILPRRALRVVMVGQTAGVGLKKNTLQSYDPTPRPSQFSVGKIGSVARMPSDPKAGGWRPISDAPRDGTEVEVRDNTGTTWIDCYLVVQHGAEEGWPISATHWRHLP